MIVAFLMQGLDEHYSVLKRQMMMARSIRRHMPEAKIVQMSNLHFQQGEGVDEVVRLPMRGGDLVRLCYDCQLLILARGEDCLFIGTDVIIQRNVSYIFERNFDIASCQYPKEDRDDGAYCNDVMFVKPSGAPFIRECYDYYDSHPYIQDGWEGGQTAFRECVKTTKAKLLTLDYEMYCKTPERVGWDLSSAAIIHYRGPRKRFMQEHGPQFGLCTRAEAHV